MRFLANANFSRSQKSHQARTLCTYIIPWTSLYRRILLRRISINFPHVHYCLKATKSEIKPLESSCSMATLSYIGILFSHSTLVPTGVNKSKQNLLEKTIKKSSITYLIPNKRPSSLYLTQWVKIIYKTQIVFYMIFMKYRSRALKSRTQLFEASLLHRNLTLRTMTFGEKVLTLALK